MDNLEQKSAEQTRADQKVHDESMQRFIELANALKGEGVPVAMVAWSLMSACGIYATYSVAGNDGGLTESGVEKLTDAYKQNLKNIQSMRKAQQSAAPSN